MAVFDFLYDIIIMPLRLFFELIYVYVYKLIDNPGLSIIVLSLAMNLLVLPLYKRADEMQEEEKNIELKLSKGVAHIKKTFKGDEKMMMLQTYYRQNNYKPTYVFRSSISLFLEIPFFIAAYQFLSHLVLLKDVPFGILKDLSEPDGLLVIGGLVINVMPFIMTGINLISCAIFTKGYPMKQKLKLYAMAIFFLVFLYTSPSGLVFYWTLNNLFSLVKTLCYKIKWPKKEKEKKIHPFNKGLLVATTVYLAVLLGGLIPSSVIVASPLEFIGVAATENPLMHIWTTLAIALGAFGLWFNIFYMLCKDEHKHIFETVLFGVAAVATVNYMCFAKFFGNLTTALQYETGVTFESSEITRNTLVILGVLIVAILICYLFRKYVAKIMLVLCMVLIVMSGWNMIKISGQVNDKLAGETIEGTSYFTLSKTGKNVVVIMLDRAVGEYIPFFFDERPELKESYSGFTYYSNVLSYSGFTIGGAPALFGGYEYTPVEINKRSEELNVSKHNEALSVMPTVFANNGFEVTVHDMPLVNYSSRVDYSIFEDMPNVNCLTDTHVLDGNKVKGSSRKLYDRNLLCYSLMKVLPWRSQVKLYDEGNYFNTRYRESTLGQIVVSDNVAYGVNKGGMDSYIELDGLDKLTKVTNEDKNTFFVMANDLPHEAMYYQAPNYTLSMAVDNTDYEIVGTPSLVAGDRKLSIKFAFQRMHYYSNYSAILRLAKWLDYLKENDVYDNTRIILVSDHGRYIFGNENMVLGDGILWEGYYQGNGDEGTDAGFFDLETYYPLLMVKDFGSTEFAESEEFMTNADVPTIAMKGLIDNPVNPFTGKVINSDEKYSHDQIVMGVHDWNWSFDGGNVFESDFWFSVHDDMRDSNNWEILWGFKGFVQ